MFKFLQLQIQNPSKGDWASSCKENLKDLDLELSFDEIRTMPTTKYKRLVSAKLKPLAFTYLMSRRGEKGKEIQYKEIEMAEYLLPNNSLNIENKRTIFSIRNRMVQISANFHHRRKISANVGVEKILICCIFTNANILK